MKVIKYDSLASVLSELISQKDAAETATDQTMAALADALATTDVSADHISYTIGQEPDSSGASSGTIGAYFKEDGVFQKVEWDGSAWVEIGEPIVSRKYVDDKASLLDGRMDVIEESQLSGSIGYEDKAEMDADTSQNTGAIGRVMNDPTPANNGIYRFDGSAWVKQASLYATELDPEDESEAVTGRAVARYAVTSIQSYRNAGEEGVAGTQYPNQIVSLIKGGQDGLSLPTHGQSEEDYQNVWCKNSHGYRLISESSDPSTTLQYRFVFTPEMEHDGFCRVGAWVYIPDPDKISVLQIELRMRDEGGSVSDTIIIDRSEHIEGWNLFRSGASAFEQGDIERIRVVMRTSEPTYVTIGHVFLEVSEKAKLMFINDYGFRGFRDTAYADLKSINFPVEWAIQPGRLEQSGGPNDPNVMTKEEILALADDPQSYFSFHSWLGPEGPHTSSMSEWELREDTIKSVRWLKRYGLIGPFAWRAAVYQNNAPEHETMRDIVVSYRSATGGTGSGLIPVPFSTQWNLRPAIGHTLSESNMDETFAQLKQTKQLLMVYTHDIGSGSGEMSQDQWDYFFNHVQAGANAGWLEGTSMEMLMRNDPRNLSITTHPDFIRATSQ